MITEWYQTADDSCVPPDTMAVSGFVRRRSWERRCPAYCYELAAHLGVEDFQGMLVICWTAQVWQYGVRQDFMSSGTKLYTGMPVPGDQLVELADLMKPTEVKFYALWGDLLFETLGE